MASARRLRQSDFRCDSAWSPMPEHLLNIRLDENNPSENVEPAQGVIKDLTCDICNMTFKTQAMVIYHKAAFCVGNTTESVERPQSEAGSYKDHILSVTSLKGSDLDVTSDGTIKKDGYVSTPENLNVKKLRLPTWHKVTGGDIPQHAVVVEETDCSKSFVCLAYVDGERLPGTLHDGKASFASNGNEVIVTEYNILNDPDNQLLWTRCDVEGGIPRDAVKGGHSKKNLQYFVARATCPDGTKCCGQYVPHDRKCYYVWGGRGYRTDNFEFLCKK